MPSACGASAAVASARPHQFAGAVRKCSTRFIVSPHEPPLGRYRPPRGAVSERERGGSLIRPDVLEHAVKPSLPATEHATTGHAHQFLQFLLVGFPESNHED